MNKRGTTDFVNPFSKLAEMHVAGLDYVATQLSEAEPPNHDPTEDEVLGLVLDYLSEVFDFGDEEFVDLGVSTAIANAVNEYLDGAPISSIEVLGLLSVPVGSLGSHIVRLQQQSALPKSINGPAAKNQASLAIAKANFEYWMDKVVASPLGDWEPFLNGNVAIDTSNIPYWVEAAIIGASAGFNQIKACDGSAALTHSVTALGGSIAVGAGKVIFGWVPKAFGRFPRLPFTPSPSPSPARLYGYDCYYRGNWVNGGTVEADSPEHAQGILNNSTAEFPGLQCHLQVA